MLRPARGPALGQSRQIVCKPKRGDHEVVSHKLVTSAERFVDQVPVLEDRKIIDENRACLQSFMESISKKNKNQRGKGVSLLDAILDHDRVG